MRRDLHELLDRGLAIGTCDDLLEDRLRPRVVGAGGARRRDYSRLRLGGLVGLLVVGLLVVALLLGLLVLLRFGFGMDRRRREQQTDEHRAHRERISTPGRRS